jgi:cytochrome d ubiquinol oxidase subunit II
MATIWFLLVAAMLVGYVVLDGFDLGVGVLYKLVAHTPQERNLVRRSIGPVWDANEVWLLAAGGTLYFAFPPLYAAAFSGFYLPLMLVLWLLIGRALGLELRSHLPEPLAQEICDALFMVSSLLLAIVFGAALGNVIRGVPLDAEGYFFLPLWTGFSPFAGDRPGVLDWYTVLCGVVALIALATHGAHYLVLRTSGEVAARARRLARLGTRALPLATAASLLATLVVRPSVLANYRAAPVGFLLPATVAASFVIMERAVQRGQERAAFGASCAYLVGMLGGAAFALYPVLLPASGDPARAITLANAATSPYAMRVAMIWWLVAAILVMFTFRYLYRSFRGKLTVDTHADSGYGEH